MELFLVKVVAFTRPLVSMRFGEEFFALVGIGLFGLLAAAVLVRAAVAGSLRLSAIDALILAFMTWCIARAVAYQDTSYIDSLAKLLIPLFSYTIVKNVVSDRGEYRHVLFWIIAGFSIATLLSAGLIAIGDLNSLDTVKYQTGVPRWQGAYSNPHTFGHSITLLLMTIALYLGLRDPLASERNNTWARLENTLLLSLAATALYCLYMSRVRASLLGLLVFAGLYSYFHNKKLFLLGGSALAALAVVTAPIWIPDLLHEFAADRRGGQPELMEMGSGRLVRWTNDMAVYAQLPIDQKLAGIGIGVRHIADDTEIGGHSDWLRIFWDTGAIGFALFASLQILILRAILRMHGQQRHLFLAMFAAVNVMMLVSNSYTLRIQVGQLYYMMLAFIEMPPNRAQLERPIVKAAD